MMLVRTELRTSSIHGIGVFLVEPVTAGTVIWQFDSRVDRVYSTAEVESLPANSQAYLGVYATWHASAQVWVLCGDNGRHSNHSGNPNTRSDGVAFGQDVAVTYLPAGTELTSDYRTICDAVRVNGLVFA